MLEVTPAKLKRLYKAMSDIACRETSYNPFKGAIWYYNGWLYATDSFCIVRVELSWLKYEGRWGKLYVVQGTDDKALSTWARMRPPTATTILATQSDWLKCSSLI